MNKDNVQSQSNNNNLTQSLQCDPCLQMQIINLVIIIFYQLSNFRLLFIEYMMNLNIAHERKETPVKQYKVITHYGNKICKKNSSELEPIQQNWSQKELIRQNNIFAQQTMQKEPESFIENAKVYQLVGYKIMKNYNPKKQKKKYQKRADSGTSRLSKLSSTRSIPEKWLPQRDNLLDQAQKIEIIVKRNKLQNTNTRFYHSKDLLKNFNNIWIKKDNQINKKLGRKEKCSLVSLSSAYRDKVQILQENSLKQKINNIGPADWFKTLREEIKLQDIYNKKYVQKIYRSINCQRRQYLKLWDKTTQPNKFLAMSLGGNSKFMKEINCVKEISKKKSPLYNQKIF